jgi:hypothetical protein
MNERTKELLEPLGTFLKTVNQLLEILEQAITEEVTGHPMGNHPGASPGGER